MKTSNFSQVGRKVWDEECVSIALYGSKYVEVTRVDTYLAPSRMLLSKFRNSEISEEEYILIFNSQLEKLDCATTYTRLQQATAPHEPILLCHCAKGAFCHRHLVASWFESRLGVKIPELGDRETHRSKGMIVKKMNPMNQTDQLF